MDRTELVKELERLRSENQQVREENASLRKEVAVALEQVAIAREVFAQLTARIERLEGQAAKDSHNSSKPPSSDGPASAVRKTKSLRGPSGRQSGGQPGHAGHTLLMVAHPDRIITLAPTACEQCQQDLATGEVTREERAQVKVCPCCQQETRAAFPDGLQPAAVQYGPMTRALAVYLQCMHLLPYARTYQILSDLLGISFSQASLHGALQCASQQVEGALDAIKAGLIDSQVMHNDETGFRVAGRCLWLHVAATPQLTYYQYHEKRGTEATDAIGILPQFHGISVHDSWASYLHYACMRSVKSIICANSPSSRSITTRRGPKR